MDQFEFEMTPWDDYVREVDDLFQQLFPICRSITGNGVRETLLRLQEMAPFEIREIPSGTVCYDWVVPEEWNIRAGFIEDSKGRRIIDFDENNLHVVNYSVPVDKQVSFQKLEQHIHYLPDLPQAIPYRTTYYNRNWGFCLSHEQYQQLNRNEQYHVFIDSTLEAGSLTYGETIIQGTSGREFLISTYCCHPSLANDNLSGQILWALLLRELQTRKTRHSYRFIIVPETIGAIAYLSQNEESMQRSAGGFIPTTVAGPGQFGYKQTFLGNHLIDRVVRQTFRELNIQYIEYPFDINGSDEAHYSAPFFRIPIGTISKDKYYEYDFYHTSLDNLDFVSAANLVESFKLYLLAIEKLEMNNVYESLNPYSEPMLGKRGLYPEVGGSIKQPAMDFEKNHLEREYRISTEDIIYGNELDTIRWLMFYSDGSNSLLDIAEKTSIPMRQLSEVASKLVAKRLLRSAPENQEGMR
jgi:aminopeptidase-like protein